jgi:hypothetical protein
MARKKTKKQKLGFKGQMLLSVAIIGAAIFIASAVFLIIAMIPTFVTLIADRSKERLKSYTIGFMNFAGAFPFWLDLVTTNHTVDYAINLATQPATIVVIYAAAAIGYLINWSIVGIVANIMVQKADKRVNVIEDRKLELKQRWGEEVAGDIRLDKDGFPISETSD